MSALRRSDLIAAIEDAKSTLRRLELMLEAYDSSTSSSNASDVYKTESNRLTEAGKNELKRLMSMGKTDSEIARILDLTPAAVYRYRP